MADAFFITSMSTESAARTLSPAEFEQWVGSLNRPCYIPLQMGDSHPWAGAVFPDYYSIMGIAEDASNEEIKASFAKQILKSHPDKQGPLASNEQRSAASARTRVLMQAKNVLLDSTMRATYDAERARHKVAGSSSRPRDYQQPSDEADVDMAHVWEVWINVVIDGFKHQYSTGTSGERTMHVLGTILPPMLGTIIDGERGLRLGLTIATVMNRDGIVQVLRDLPPQDQEVFMAAMEAICKKMWQ